MLKSSSVNSTNHAQANLKHLDRATIQSIPEIWAIARTQFGDTIALRDPHAQPEVVLTYAQLSEKIQQFGAGLQALGIKTGDRVSLFADNQPRWLIADQGMMIIGVVNAVRGAQADKEELLYILSHSDSVALIVQDLALLRKLSKDLDSLPVKLAILLSDEQLPQTNNVKILNFSQVIELGTQHSLQPAQLQKKDLATLMYTSGTSGMPKGVMLSHGNLLSQVFGARAVVEPQPGERVLSILPVWHCYERSFEYFTLAHGCTQIYTNIRTVKKDLKDFQPYYMVGVPRLWESIYEGVQKQFREQPAKKRKLINFLLAQSQRYILARRIVQGLDLNNLHHSTLEKIWAGLQTIPLTLIHQVADKLVYQQVRAATGGQVKFLVSGGGSIAEHLEDFYEIVGITILGGYGLTETSPITHVRRTWRNLRGADGQPLPNTETQIVDLETKAPLPPETQGLVMIRGDQVMQGYYKNPEATAKAISPQGWFDTGDLGWVSKQNDLIITGRAKDTIVLSNGENIEPQPIEDACLRSPYIAQIMLVGQDERLLGALIVPNLEALQAWADNQNLQLDLLPSPETALNSKVIQDLYRQELTREVQNRPGYRADDRIGPFKFILEPFSLENGMMTQTLKIKRSVVMERYHDIINGMFA
ncbi:AMP-binding protein [Aliterella atlantica]|uniref:Long-chain fatty acid--CoA ligase n=1 Tax=Aliterella atlantica CENA595 TaxID=1618023 RepID=A0A0D8ZWW2_9CYAN|nr:AMP-binding protein [Aliterella atlantica]KJH72939.1 long-chain fatty acid--CoA ligase [Aliterella atlantica CENA595]